MVDQPTYALQFSDAERQRYRGMAARAVTDEAALWTAAGIVSGARVADIGCGPGAVLVEIARIVGAGGEAVGVEPDTASRDAALEEVTAAGGAWVRVVKGSATATGLVAASFDVVMIRHVLFHLGSQAPAALRHSSGLLRRDGHAYLVDVDLRARGLFTSAVDSDVEDLYERYLTFQEGRGCDVSIGSRLGELLEHAGLEVAMTDRLTATVPGQLLASGGPVGAAIPAMIEAGVASAADEARWRAALSRFASTPGASVSTSMDVAIGRRSS